ncbi:MAG TPA: hypothetical protein VIL35_01225 [Vicinamibacterales bacterium]
MSARRCGAWLLAGFVLCPAMVQAQQEASEPSRFEVTAGGGWWGGYDLGTQDAVLTGPQRPSGEPVTLFITDAAVGSGPAVEARVGVRLARSLLVEATGGVGFGTVDVAIRGDAEGAPATAVSSSLTQFTLEGGVVLELDRVRWAGGRLLPFVGGGAGYVRQVHEDRLLVETGGTAHVGGGLKFRRTGPPARLLDRLLWRADVRLVVRGGGVETEGGGARLYLAATTGVGLRF